MRATWFQKFLRWTTVFLAVCFGVDLWQVQTYKGMTEAAHGAGLAQVVYQVQASAWLAFWAIVGHFLMLGLLVSAVMLVLAELVAWCARGNQWRQRRRDERAIKKAVEEYTRDGF